MTIAEMVDKYGEIRISRINGITVDEKTGVALIVREIINNQVVEHNVPQAHYRVAPRDADPVMADSVDNALALVK
jgi:hypothetical protein